MYETSEKSNKDIISDLTSPKNVISFMSIQFIAFFFYGGFRTIFPLILHSFDFTETQVIDNWAFILTFGLIIGFFTRMPMGVVADKLSRRASLILGTAICSFSISLMFLTTSVSLLNINF